MFTRKKESPAPLALAPLEQSRPATPAQQQPQQHALPAQAQAPQPAPQPPRPKPVSVMTQGLTIRGDVVGDVEVHLDCVVMGDVKVGKLIVGPNARVEGSVVAQVIEVHGLVIGPITAQAVRLYGTSRVDGDITHEQLAMETGAAFEGRSQKFRRTSPPAAQPQPQPQPIAPAPVAQQPQPFPVEPQPHPQMAPQPQMHVPSPAPAPAPAPQPVTQQAPIQPAPAPYHQPVPAPAAPQPHPQLQPFPASPQSPFDHATH